jgi:hypothetical protein
MLLINATLKLPVHMNKLKIIKYLSSCINKKERHVEKNPHIEELPIVYN